MHIKLIVQHWMLVRSIEPILDRIIQDHFHLSKVMNQHTVTQHLAQFRLLHRCLCHYFRVTDLGSWSSSGSGLCLDFAGTVDSNWHQTHAAFGWMWHLYWHHLYWLGKGRPRVSFLRHLCLQQLRWGRLAAIWVLLCYFEDTNLLWSSYPKLRDFLSNRLAEQPESCDPIQKLWS